jgi:hypothetical protein
MNEPTIQQWKENLDEPLPGMEPEAEVVRRTIVFSHNSETPWIAVYDYLKTDGPATFDYLLHSLEKMHLDQNNQYLLVKGGEVEMDVYFLSPSALHFRQSGKFPIAPEERYEGAPDQWHFTASSIEETDEMRYLVLMIPRNPKEDVNARYEVTRIDYGNVQGFQLGDEKVLAWWGKGENGDFSPAGSNENAKLIIEYTENGGKRYKLVQ